MDWKYLSLNNDLDFVFSGTRLNNGKRKLLEPFTYVKTNFNDS